MKKVLFAISVLFCNVCMAQDELPAIKKNGASFYIPATTLKKYHLKAANGDAWMKVYNNETKNEAGGVTRLNDIRWEAPNANDAGVWILMNFEMLSEGNKDVTKTIKKPAGVQEWNVYSTGDKQIKMNEAFGIELQFYCFVFSVDKYVGKIFVSTNKTLKITDAYKLAEAGIKATIAAAKK